MGSRRRHTWKNGKYYIDLLIQRNTQLRKQGHALDRLRFKGLAQGPNRELTLPTSGFESMTDHRLSILSCWATSPSIRRDLTQSAESMKLPFMSPEAWGSSQSYAAFCMDWSTRPFPFCNVACWFLKHSYHCLFPELLLGSSVPFTQTVMAWFYNPKFSCKENGWSWMQMVYIAVNMMNGTVFFAILWACSVS